MSARIENTTPDPDVTTAVQHIYKAVYASGLPREIVELVHLRASQINGCSACVNAGVRSAGQGGVSTEKLLTVAAWYENPLFDDAERAALALTEAVTRLSDRTDPVPDAVWDEAAKYYGEKELAALVLWISTVNVFNRINVATRQVPGQWAHVPKPE